MSITIASNFTLNTNLPLDDRAVFADATARNALSSTRRYIGLMVYLLSDSTIYQLQGGILDANWVALGLLTNGSQTIGGAKTFTGGVSFNSFLEFDNFAVDSTGGANINLGNFNKLAKKVDNGSLTSIGSITAPSNVRLGCLANDTGNTISVRNEYAPATAANRIITGTGSDLSVRNGAALWFLYDPLLTRWRVIGGSGGGGGGRYVHPTTIDVAAAGNIAGSFSVDFLAQSFFVRGNAGPQSTNLPFGNATPTVGNGMRVTLFGDDDAQPLTITFNDASYGCVGAFSDITLYKNDSVSFELNVPKLRWYHVGGKLS